MEYLVANSGDIKTLARLGRLLWPEHDVCELEEGFADLLNSNTDELFLASDENKQFGFIHVSIKQDYVNGASTSPVGYVEGIYIEPEYRDKGIARKLISMGEEWAQKRGCTEMGSDVLVDNLSSMKFHEKIGFKEVERVVCYIKPIK